MDGKQKAVAARIYQDFEPPTELSSENDSDTILVYVPGNLNSLSFSAYCL